MERDYIEEERYDRAKKKIKDIKGFYWHLFWYLIVNLFLTFGNSISGLFHGERIVFNNLDFGIFSLWFFWGIGLASHWIKVFGKNIFFSKDWEERKIKEYMNQDNESK